METKNVYRYDEKGYFEHKVVLDDTDRSPVSGNWQIPAYCTEVEPPSTKEGFKIKWNGEGWEYEEDTKDKEPEPEKPTFEELKQQKIQELKWERDRKEVEPIAYNGHVYDYDDKARDRINAAIIALDLQGEKASIEWTLADNSNITVTANDLRAVIGAVALRSNALHVAYRTAKEKVEACESEQELEKIVLG
jgi:hypothetical protein